MEVWDDQRKCSCNTPQTVISKPQDERNKKKRVANREISMMLPGNRANRERGERGSDDGARLAAGAGTTVIWDDDSRGVGRSKSMLRRDGGVEGTLTIARDG